MIINIPKGTRFAEVYRNYRAVLHAHQTAAENPHLPDTGKKPREGEKLPPGTEEVAMVFSQILTELDAEKGVLNSAARDRIRAKLNDDGRRVKPLHYYHIYNTWIFILRTIPDSGVTVDDSAEIHIDAQALYHDTLDCADDAATSLQLWSPVIRMISHWADRQISRAFAERKPRFGVLYGRLLSCLFFVENIFETLLGLTWEQVWLPTRLVNGKNLPVDFPHIRFALQAHTRGQRGEQHTIILAADDVAFLERNWPESQRAGYLFGDPKATPALARDYRAYLAERFALECGTALPNKKWWAELEGVGQMAHKAYYSPPFLVSGGQGQFRLTYTSNTSERALRVGAADLNYGDTRPAAPEECTEAELLRTTTRNARKELTQKEDNINIYGVFDNYCKHMTEVRHKPGPAARLAKSASLAHELDELVQTGALPTTNPLAVNLVKMAAWAVSRISVDKAPKTAAKELRMAHNWVLSYIGETPLDKAPFMLWTTMIRDFNAGYKQDWRRILIDLVTYLVVTDKADLDTKALYQSTFVAKDYPAEPVELLGALEARDIFLAMPEPLRWYFALQYGLGLRTEEAHLLTVRSIIQLEGSPDIIVAVHRSKSSAGTRLLPARLLMPPAIYAEFLPWARARLADGKKDLSTPLIPRWNDFETNPDKLDSGRVERELGLLRPALRNYLAGLVARKLCLHDLRRTFSNCLALRMLENGETFQGCRLQPIAYDPAGAPWCPVPAAYAHELYNPWGSAELAHRNLDRVLWFLLAAIMGHQDPRTTAGTYFQMWLPVTAAWQKRAH